MLFVLSQELSSQQRDEIVADLVVVAVGFNHRLPTDTVTNQPSRTFLYTAVDQLKCKLFEEWVELRIELQPVIELLSQSAAIFCKHQYVSPL
jgi:hypothetical protein